MLLAWYATWARRSADTCIVDVPIKTCPYNRTIHALNETLVEDRDAPPSERVKDVRFVLDCNRDNRITPEDFANITPQQFTSIERLLTKHGISLRELVALPNITWQSFAEYRPVPQEKTYTIADPLVHDYFTKLPDTNMLLDKRDAQSHQPVIADRQRFTALILQTAAELGLSREDIAALSIHDAILLCGQIVAHRLTYDHGMISDAEKKLVDSIDKTKPDWKMQMLAKMMTAGDLRNDHAKAIDTRPTDQILSDGHAICRNYAPVNAAVFAILKEINPQLRNTYMTVFSPNADHAMALPHAWNMVSTLTATGVESTYVDPTWLDTRSRTARADGTVTAESPETMYNAMDDSHFGKAQWRLKHYLRDLFTDAGNVLRDSRMAGQYESSNIPLQFYSHQAASYNLEIIEGALERLPAMAAERRTQELQAIADLLVDVFSEMTGLGIADWSALQWNDPATTATFECMRKQIPPALLAACKKIHERIAERYPHILTMPVSDLGRTVQLRPMYQRLLSQF